MYLFLSGGRAEGEGVENLKQTVLDMEPRAGPRLTNLKSAPEPKLSQVLNSLSHPCAPTVLIFRELLFQW